MVHEIHNIIQDLVRTVIVKLTGNNYALVFRQKTLQKTVNEVPDNLFVRKKLPVNNFMYGLQFCEDLNVLIFRYVFSAFKCTTHTILCTFCTCSHFFLSVMNRACSVNLNSRLARVKQLLPFLPTAPRHTFYA